MHGGNSGGSVSAQKASLVSWPSAGSTHLDLLYSNSMCRQSSIPTSILIELVASGSSVATCTRIVSSWTMRLLYWRMMVTRTK